MVNPAVSPALIVGESAVLVIESLGALIVIVAVETMEPALELVRVAVSVRMPLLAVVVGPLTLMTTGEAPAVQSAQP